MELREAYRELEVAVGANEATVREAKKVLAKVWHPDKHAHDPSVLARAQAKVRAVNEAFEVIRAAGFPAADRVAPGAKVPDLTTTASPIAARPAPLAAPPAPPEARSTVEVVGRRRMRLWVVALFAAALAVGAYLAIVQLGARVAPAAPVAVASDAGAPRDPVVAAPIDAGIDASEVSQVTAIDGGAPFDPLDPLAARGPRDPLDPPPPSPPPMAATPGTITLGSTREQVRSIMGPPTTIHQVIHETWRWGFSQIEFDDHGVVGWWEMDTALKTSLPPRDPAVAAAAKARGSFGKGASKDEILGILGTPTHVYRVINETWSYSYSKIEFDDDGRVVDWFDADVRLPHTP
ncbi:MAG: DnaJ domain-containing protein [Deltaproteobacteria bacterium]|nr:DnaJ domain-containing protein [Deltaproteobacteria bacterium]